MTETVKAYAKINIHLDVCGKRDDGYHDVELVMQTVSLCDRVSVELSAETDIVCECSNPQVPTGQENIACRAARLFLDSIGKSAGVKISIDKHIPMAAGLAGGSTDAAATLVALNRLCGKPLGEAELCALGSRLGADVPFCICGGTLFTDGRGDVLHDFPTLSENTAIVIACGGEGVSTPWAYRMLDKKYNDFKHYKKRGTEGLRDALLSDDSKLFYKHMFNIFEEPVFAERPVAADLKAAFMKNGALCSMMSGSGPSVFAVFNTKEEAQAACCAIKKQFPDCTVEACHPTPKTQI